MQTFDLRAELIDPAAGQLTVAVTHSPAGEVDAVRVIVPPITPAQAMNCTARRLAGLAAEFTAALLPPPLWAAWRESVAAAGSAGVRLRIRTAGGAAALPWELLYDAARATYLALDPLTPVVRYLEGPAGPILPAGSEPPLLLLAAAAPRDLPDPGAGALDALADALAPDVAAGRVRIERVDHLSARRLEAALLDRQPALFHFHGHSFWSSYDGAGGLALEGQDGRAELLDGATLATLLGAARVRLAVLNACSSASAGVDRWSGLAQGLVRQGMPAVVAHQGAVQDDLARAFAGRFYAALVKDGAVDRAVTAGRIAMARQCAQGDQAGAWLAPLLFLRGEAVLWPAADASAAEARNRAVPSSPVSSPSQGSPIERGAITIGTLNAGTVVMGDADIHMSGPISFPPAQAPAPDPRQDELAAGQAELLARQEMFRREILAALSASERRVVTGVLDGVDAQHRRLVEEVMLAVQGGQAPPAEAQALLDAVAAVRAEVHSHGAALAGLRDQLDVLAAGEVVGPTEAEVKHRLVMTVPIVPFILGYEGEIELKSRFGLDAAWQALLRKVRGASD